MSSLFQNTQLNIHNAAKWPLPFPVVDASAHEEFGTVSIKPIKTDINKTPICFLFTIDATGSMNTPAGRSHVTKVHHLKQTFRSMLLFLVKQPVEIFVHVNSFNTTVESVIDLVQITDENVKELIHKVDQIEADSMTDLGIALDSAKKFMSSYSLKNPEHQLAHIFMTDGSPTTGVTDYATLCEMIHTSSPNVFVGFGTDHNAHLMRKLSETKNGDYQFVDNMENTGLVYGETIHSLLYPTIKDVEIRITNGKLFNWQTNEWTDVLYEPVLVGDMEKVYHIKTAETNLVEVCIVGRAYKQDGGFEPPALLETIDLVPDLLDGVTGDVVDCEKQNLTKYAFRQRVQELLYLTIHHDSLSSRSLEPDFKEAFRTLRKYMRENGLLEDAFYKNLCDDLSITFKTMGTSHSDMFALARGSSQGKQKAYNTSATVDYDDMDHMQMPVLRRNARMMQGQTQEIDELVNSVLSGVAAAAVEDDISTYIPSNDATNCYSTPAALDTMRCMSQI